jgi:hypothetical protein
MPSSTSSSKDRLPRVRWGATWIAAVAITGIVAGGWEMLVRYYGAGIAAIDDNAERWGHERERAALLGRDALILVGASEMQMAMDLATLRERTGLAPVQLAISASPFLPLLEDLASDERIKGTVVVAFSMGAFFDTTKESISAQWVDRYRRLRGSQTQVFYRQLEDALERMASESFVSLATGARPQQLFGRERSGYVRTLPDRSRRADYEAIDREAAYRHRVDVYLSGSEPSFRAVPDRDARFVALESLIRRIEGRGGRVVLMRFPTTKRIFEMDEVLYPRSVYWDELARRTSARTIHFADYAALSRFDLPDGVHLDFRDAPAFTEAVVTLLLEGGVGVQRR